MSNSKLVNKITSYSVLAIGTYLVGKSIMRTFNKFPLSNKVVLITGGARGLGIILARQMAEEEAKIVICGRTEESLHAASEDLNPIIKNHIAIQCDITDKQQIKQMIRRITNELGTIDILINNAEIVQVGSMELMNEADYSSALDVHFWGPLHIMNEVLPAMKRKDFGRIVNIVSTGGMISFPHLLPYNVSQLALSGLSKGISGELNNFNIKVTTVYPGLMRTGSPVNVYVKDRHEKEYDCFKISDSSPFISKNAERAASKIIDAMKNGDKSLTLTLPAKFVNTAQAIAPEFMLSVFNLVNQLIPAKPDTMETGETNKGYESESKITKSGLTKKTEAATERNLE